MNAVSPDNLEGPHNWSNASVVSHSKPLNNVFNVGNIASTWALISVAWWVSGSVRVSLRDELSGEKETSACEKTLHESCSKAQASSDWINIY